jgi:Fe-S-cluster containining protein
MARRKLPVLTERSLAQMKAERIQISSEVDAKLPEVSCKAGCHACCSYPIYISILEGILLYRHLTARGHWTAQFRKKLERHADQTFDLSANVWLLLDLPCPVLDKGKCLAYEARPFTCRTLYARSDPKLCHPHRATEGSFVDRKDATARFRAAERKILGRHQLSLLGMPISKAILLGEKIVNGEGDLEHYFTLAVESLRRQA